MCGILGFVDAPWQEQGPRALDALASRGPDDAGHWSDGQAWFGHRRLSIIDLAGGHQPMTSRDGRHSIVFNGEIFNFAELRADLEALGRRFDTRSDTEVLLQGHAEWGSDLLPRLDGMFAYAIWDTREKVLFAARDRMGVKPFFYSTAGGFSFASTLRPFLALPGFPRSLDFEALRDYLGFQCIVAPRSMLSEVRQLEPAQWLRYDAASRRLTLGRYWRIPGPGSEAPPAADLLAATDRALASSVQRQMVSDVPLGAFLSGGIDSSLMVHYMAHSGARPLMTFSVRFPQQGFDETAHARAVAQQYGTDHHVIDAPDIDAETFTAAIGDLDQPLADPAYVATWQLSRLTRRHVTVAISGDGGDELFGGYPRFLDTEASHPDSMFRAAARRLVLAGLLPGALLRRTLAGKDLLLYRKLDLGPWPVSRKSLAAYLEPHALAAARPAAVLAEWRELASSFGGRWDTASLMRADLWSYLSDNCLMKTDRASMAHGLEVRVPMLGNAVADLVLGLPARAHFDPEGKALLRGLARRHLPESVWNRPKHGFSVPISDYFRGAWKVEADRLVARCAELAPFLNPAAVAALWRGAREGRASRRLAYSVVVLLIWIEKHSDRLMLAP